MTSCGWCTARATGRAVREDGQAWDYCERHAKKATHEAGAVVNGKTTVAFTLTDPPDDVRPRIVRLLTQGTDVAMGKSYAEHGDLLTFLHWSADAVRVIEEAQRVAVEELRRRGESWPTIGHALRVTKQSAQARFTPKRPPAQPAGATLLDVLADDDGAGYGADAARGARSDEGNGHGGRQGEGADGRGAARRRREPHPRRDP